MSESGSVAVIGGGPAGLAAAWRLSASGRRVTVYEWSPRVGGGLRTEVVAGRGADAVVQLVSDGYTALAELLSALELSDRLVRVPGRDALWRGGRAHELRYGSVTSMARSGSLPPGLKVRLALRYVPFLERQAGRLELNDPTRAAAAGLDGESIAEWGERELGPDFVELLAYPLLASYYGVTPEETSAGLFHALARAGLRVRVMGLRGGAGVVAEAVASALASRGVAFRTDARVSALEAGPGRVRVTADDSDEAFDAAVVATPAAEAARLVPGARFPADVASRAAATLVLGLREPVRPGWFGLCIPRREPGGDRVAAICAQREKRTGLEAGGDALVVIPSPGEGETWATAEPRDVLAAAMPVVERALPGAGSLVAEARLVRRPHGPFIPAPGHFRPRDPDAGVPARVALAGDYLVAPTVEGAVRAGIRAAARITGAGW